MEKQTMQRTGIDGIYVHAGGRHCFRADVFRAVGSIQRTRCKIDRIDLLGTDSIQSVPDGIDNEWQLIGGAL